MEQCKPDPVIVILLIVLTLMTKNTRYCNIILYQFHADPVFGIRYHYSDDYMCIIFWSILIFDFIPASCWSLQQTLMNIFSTRFLRVGRSKIPLILKRCELYFIIKRLHQQEETNTEPVKTGNTFVLCIRAAHKKPEFNSYTDKK